MIYVISGTNRPGSRTRQVSQIVADRLKKHTPDVEIIDLAQLSFSGLTGAQYGGSGLPTDMASAIAKVDSSDGIVIVTPEYNGSMPGALKYFIDHWSYPRSFEYRPVAFVGLGFRWGGLRPVEHLQQVFGYRNAFSFPERVFLTNIGDVLKDGQIVDKMVSDLLDKQANGFVRFIAGLKSQGLLPTSK
jgi:NAD(P)H-dependent FMN reductase